MSRPMLDMSVLPDVVTSPVMSPFDQTFAMMSPTLASPVMGSGMMMGGPNQGPHFGPTKQLYNLYTADQGQALFVRMDPKADKGFFRANDTHDWICYRRNYFSTAAAFSIVTELGESYQMPCLLESGDNLLNVVQFAICIKAKTVDGEKEIPIIQQTPKRDKGPQMIPQPLPVRPGGSPYSHINTRDRLAIFERLQFKLATANNGRRRMGVQQYYKLTMELHATLENGESVVLASIDSCSLVVRGRSPNHYLDIDIPKRGLMASPMMSTTMSPSTGFAALSLQRTPQMECQSPLSTHVFTFNPMTSPPSTATASPNRTPGLVNLAFMGTSSQREIRPQLLTSPHLNELPPLLIPQHVSRQRSETVSSINSAVSLEELCEFPTNLEMPASLQDLMYPTDTKDFSLNMDMPTTTGPLPTMASTVSPSQSFEALSYPAVSFQSPSLMSPAAISEFGGFF